jgi:hypothetical protein
MMAKRTTKERVFRSIEEFKRELFPKMVRAKETSEKTIGTGLAAEIFAEIRKKAGASKKA